MFSDQKRAVMTPLHSIHQNCSSSVMLHYVSTESENFVLLIQKVHLQFDMGQSHPV